MKKNFLLAALAVAALVSLSGAAQADIIYSENFDGLTVGTTLAASDANWQATADYAVEAADAHFGSNHLAVTTTAANFNFANWDDGVTGRQLLTASFDVIDDGSMAPPASTSAGIRLASSRTTSNGALLDFNDGSLADNTVFNLRLVTNISGSAVLYEDGVTSIAANSFDVWTDGVRTTTSGTLVGAGAGDFDGIGLWARRPDAALRIDNLEFRNTAYNGVTAAVPEPTSLALLGLGVFGLVVRRRR